MTVFHAICVEDYRIEDDDGAVLELKRGQEYTTSKPWGDGTVTVFTRYWARVPERLFAGARPLGGDR